MNKVVIKKEVDKEGYVDIFFCRGTSDNARMWFRNETQYKAFVFLINLLEESGASSISISDEPEEENEAPVNKKEIPDSSNEVCDNGD